MDTESLAVSEVNSALGVADYLKSYITQGEKGPCLDGYICTYSKKGYKKADEAGRAPAQVKGREATSAELMQDRISYQVDLADLMTYRREGGTIFFVVLIDKDNPTHKRIYYNPLLPYDLNEIIGGKENQDSIAIHLKPFPTGKAMEDVVLTFAGNRIKQFGIVQSDEFHNYSFKEIIEKGGVAAPYSFNIGYTSIQKDEDRRPFSYFFDHDFYIYYHSDPFGSLIPMQHISRMEMVSTNVPCSLKVGNVEFFNRCYIYFLQDRTVYGFRKIISENSVPRTSLSIENVSGQSEDGAAEKQVRKSATESIEDEKFTFLVEVFAEKDEQGRQKVNYTYKVVGDLNDRINIEEFLLALFKEDGYTLNGVISQWHPSSEDLKAVQLDAIKEQYDYLLKVRKALELIGCHEALACNGISKDDDLRLKCLVASVVDGVAVGYQNEIPEIAVYNVANLHLLLFFDRQEDGKYLIRSIPGEQVKCHTEDDAGIHPTSFYTVIDDKEYLRISNLDMDKVVNSICSFEDVVHYDRANYSVLFMLMAYDECGNNKFLDAAREIAEWLVSRDSENTTLYVMNFYQCMKRSGTLKEKDRKAIRKIIRDTKNNPEYLAGCYLLLDQSKKAAGQLSGLPLEQRRAFLSLPIAKFMDKEIRVQLES